MAGGGAAIAPGATVELSARWPTCPADACTDGVCPPCEGAEAYVWFDPVTRALTTRREAIRVSWFVNAGTLAAGHGGRTEAEGEAGQSDTRTTWTAPATPGPALLWVVVRDDRGGAAWSTVALEVGP